MVNNKLIYELRQKLLPALESKINNLHSFGYTFLSVDDVWDYMILKLWNDKKITVAEMIDDILNTPNYLIKDFYIENSKRNIGKELFQELL